MQLKPGSLLQGGKYQIEKVLGQGGFGITYLGVQTILNRKVAIKEFFMKDLCYRDESTSRISVSSQSGRELVERFRQKFIKEAQTITTLKNTHIISIYDVFEENGTAYYVMEYISGSSLKEYVEARGKLPENEALKFIRQIADALAYIHEQKILHLDVKPANVLLDERTHEAILIDFGISKRYDEEDGQTCFSPVGLSKGYASLEQYNQGGMENFQPCTDIYSLGATLYFLLTGQAPPVASVVNDVGLPPLPSDISTRTRRAVELSMKPRQKERLQSVTAFLTILDEKDFINNGDKEGGFVDKEERANFTPQPKEKIKEQPNEPQEGKKPTKPRRTHKGLWIGIGIAMACIGVLTIVFVAQETVRQSQVEARQAQWKKQQAQWRKQQAQFEEERQAQEEERQAQEKERLFAILADFYDYTLKNDGTYKVTLTDIFREQLNRASGSFTSDGYAWKTRDALPNPAPGGMYKGRKVTDMCWMFYNCKNLISLDLSDFNTANVTDMSDMFRDCINLRSIDLSSFNTANVTDMSDMFRDCSNLRSLDLSGFNTSNVTNMSWMFSDCSNLTSLDLSGFNTAKVTRMTRMFNRCGSLTSLDLSSFQIKSKSAIYFMFTSCCENSPIRVTGYVKDQATADFLNNQENTSINTNKLYFKVK